MNENTVFRTAPATPGLLNGAAGARMWCRIQEVLQEPGGAAGARMWCRRQEVVQEPGGDAEARRW